MTINGDSYQNINENDDLMLSVFCDFNRHNVRNALFNLKKMAAMGQASSMVLFMDRIFQQQQLEADDVLEILLDNLENARQHTDDFKENICLKYFLAAKIFYNYDYQKACDRLLFALKDSQFIGINKDVQLAYDNTVQEIRSCQERKKEENLRKQLLSDRKKQREQELLNSLKIQSSQDKENHIVDSVLEVSPEVLNQDVQTHLDNVAPQQVAQQSTSAETHEKTIYQKIVDSVKPSPRGTSSDEVAVLKAIDAMAEAEIKGKQALATDSRTDTMVDNASVLTNIKDKIVNGDLEQVQPLNDILVLENQEEQLDGYVHIKAKESVESGVGNSQVTDSLVASSSNVITDENNIAQMMPHALEEIVSDESQSNGAEDNHISVKNNIDEHMEKVKKITSSALKKAETITSDARKKTEQLTEQLKSEALRKAETLKAKVIADSSLNKSAQKIKDLAHKIKLFK